MPLLKDLQTKRYQIKPGSIIGAVLVICVIVGVISLRTMTGSRLEDQQREVFAVVSEGMTADEAIQAVRAIATELDAAAAAKLEFVSEAEASEVAFFEYKSLMVRVEQSDGRVSRVTAVRRRSR